MPQHKPPPCYCYIVECADGSYYTGWTTDPDGRLRAHNAGRGSRYTRTRRPVRIVLLEPQTDRISAMRRERAIKGLTRASKTVLITSAAETQSKGSGRGKKARGGTGKPARKPSIREKR